MIINLILSTIVLIITTVFSILPTVTIASIPVIGTTLNSTLITIIQTWNAFMNTLPYAQVVWQCVLIILGFELLMLIGKFFLGHRMPDKTVN